MTNLQLQRGRRALLLFLTAAVLFSVFPAIDLRVSRLFQRDGRFELARSWWVTTLHASVGYFVCIALAAVVGLYAFNRVKDRKLGKVDGMTVSYLLAVLILGSGLIVNVLLKDGFGRARPRNVIELGGTQQFSPAFQVSSECESNCSFASGDSSGAFFAFALALVSSRRRGSILAAAAYGGLVSFSRIASGAHFLSDTVVSFFVMWITADVLFHFMLAPRRLADPIAPRAAWKPVEPPARGVPDVGRAPSYARPCPAEVNRGAR